MEKTRGSVLGKCFNFNRVGKSFLHFCGLFIVAVCERNGSSAISQSGFLDATDAKIGDEDPSSPTEIYTTLPDGQL